MDQRLIVISLLDGNGATGVETHFNLLLRAARERGIEAQLVSPYPCGQLWVRALRRLARIARPLHPELAELWMRRVNRALLERKLRALLAAGAPATLYAQDPLSAQAALRARSRRWARVAAVVHYNVAEADELELQGQARRGGALWRSVAAAERAALPAVDRLIFVSDFMRATVLERLPQAACAGPAVIPNFAAPPQPDDAAGLSGDMIAIGTLEPRKNQAFLLKVLAAANAVAGPYTLTLVGDGPDRAMLETLARGLGVDKQVTFAGFRRNAARLIPHHRVLVHAARIENMPITLIEALACGRPILAGAVGGIPEVFSHGVEGYCWPLDDVSAAAALLVRALGDADGYRRLADAAALRYREKFDSGKLAGQWLDTLLGAEAAA